MGIVNEYTLMGQSNMTCPTYWDIPLNSSRAVVEALIAHPNEDFSLNANWTRDSPVSSGFDVNIWTAGAVTASMNGNVPFQEMDGYYAPRVISNTEATAMHTLKYYSYGVALPAICGLGILGNVLNLIVLTRPTMRGPAYVYMRGYAAAALLALIFAVPFSGRILLHNEVGPWTNFAQAFFHTHLELFLGNACLGISVFMLVALSIERYLAVCRLGRGRSLPAQQVPLLATALAVLALILYIPYLFRATILTCPGPDGKPSYKKQEHPSFAHSSWWAVYLWVLEIVFKVAPMLLVAHLNLCIIIAYRKTCANRRRMAHKHHVTKLPSSQLITPSSVGSTNVAVNLNKPVSFSGGFDETRRYWEEKRLIFLLGSTSILFIVCTTPQVALSLMIQEAVLSSYYFQVFRAVANILELINYSFTFYIYCLFSREFRATFLRTLRLQPPREPSMTAHTCL